MAETLKAFGHEEKYQKKYLLLVVEILDTILQKI